MGWNTTVVVMNDALDVIKRDPKFGENLYHACLEVIRGKPVDVPAVISYDSEGKRQGVCTKAATVLETHHADNTVVVAVGQNYGETLGLTHFSIDNKEQVLKYLADQLGYRLSKKPAKKL